MINRRAARGGEIPFQLLDPAGPGLGVPPVPGGGAVDSPLLRRADRKDRRGGFAVIRDVLLRPFHHEIRISLQIARRDDGVPQVDGVVRDEPVAPLVVGLPELRVAGGRLGPVPQGMESKLALADIDRRVVRPVRRSHLARVAVVHDVEPVVQTETGVAQATLHVPERESGVEDLAQVSLAVAIQVLEVEDVGCGGGDQPALPRSDALDGQQSIREHRVSIDDAVSVGVFQVLDSAQRRAAGRWIVGIV